MIYLSTTRTPIPSSNGLHIVYWPFVTVKGFQLFCQPTRRDRQVRAGAGSDNHIRIATWLAVLQGHPDFRCVEMHKMCSFINHLWPTLTSIMTTKYLATLYMVCSVFLATDTPVFWQTEWRERMSLVHCLTFIVDIQGVMGKIILTLLSD